MGRHSKVDDQLEEFQGEATEKIGQATGDEELEAQGDLDRTASDQKQRAT